MPTLAFRPAARGPLHGIRILDLTTVVMGPYATQILGELGADVIKIEAPGGDPLRYAGPARHKGMGALFINTNQNKRSVVLDLKTEADRAALLTLCETADVLVYNVRPQAMARLGLGYETVRARNPAIIYAGLFGFGREGAYAGNPAYDDLIQGLAGFPAMLARSTGNAPAYVPANICDRTVGLYGVGQINAALVHRFRTGEGQQLDVPMFETMAQFMLGDNLYGETFVPAMGEPGQTTGYARLMSKARRPFPTSDGYLCVLPYTDGHWQRFLALVGRPELLTDTRFATMGARTAQIDVVYGVVADTLRTNTTAHWLQTLREADIPVAPMHDIDSLLGDAHLASIGFVTEQTHPTEGAIRVTRAPGTWSATQPAMQRHAPNLGEHTQAVLREAGIGVGALTDTDTDTDTDTTTPSASRQQ